MYNKRPTTLKVGAWVASTTMSNIRRRLNRKKKTPTNRATHTGENEKNEKRTKKRKKNKKKKKKKEKGKNGGRGEEKWEERRRKMFGKKKEDKKYGVFLPRISFCSLAFSPALHCGHCLFQVIHDVHKRWESHEVDTSTQLFRLIGRPPAYPLQGNELRTARDLYRFPFLPKTTKKKININTLPHIYMFYPEKKTRRERNKRNKREQKKE